MAFLVATIPVIPFILLCCAMLCLVVSVITYFAWLLAGSTGNEPPSVSAVFANMGFTALLFLATAVTFYLRELFQ